MHATTVVTLIALQFTPAIPNHKANLVVFWEYLCYWALMSFCMGQPSLGYGTLSAYVSRGQIFPGRVDIAMLCGRRSRQQSLKRFPKVAQISKLCTIFNTADPCSFNWLNERTNVYVYVVWLDDMSNIDYVTVEVDLMSFQWLLSQEPSVSLSVFGCRC